MPLGKDYAGQQCSLARALEIVGERWTLLILRDSFFGVRRFGDFAAHLNIPRAVLSDRLSSLTEERRAGSGRRRPRAPRVRADQQGPAAIRGHPHPARLGDEHYSDQGPRRVFRHAADDGLVSTAGICEMCDLDVPVSDLVIAPGPGLAFPPPADPVSQALATSHRLLEPLNTAIRLGAGPARVH